MGTMTITVDSFFQPNPAGLIIVAEESNDDCETVYSVGIGPGSNSSVYFSWDVSVGGPERYFAQERVTGSQSYIQATNGQTITENKLFRFTLKAYQLKKGGWLDAGSPKIQILLNVYPDSSATLSLASEKISRSGGNACAIDSEEGDFLVNF